MAKEKNKVEKTEVKNTENKTKDNVTKINLKSVKPKETVTKVDLSKPLEEKSEKVEKESAEEKEVVVVNEEPKVEKIEEQKEEQPTIEEVSNEEITVEKVEEQVEEAVIESQETGTPLPENIQKVVEFMEETGGSLNDYVNLNRDLSKLDDSEVLDEYYRTTKSHLTPEERNFILEEKFSYDNDVDDPKDIKRKKIALKEQVAEARAHLDRQKSKYYEEIKAGSRLTPEAQKAMDFFNRYNKDQQTQKKLSEKSKRSFLNKTNKVFNENFKGFDYQVGDKKFRFNVKDVDEVKKTQSDINNFINKYVDEGDSTISDVAGYHKSLFTAMNADSIAKHFYEQGKADAIKSQVAKDKNINLDPRKTHGETEVGGIKVKVLGQSSSDMKNRSFKFKKKS
tara:strand:- start:1001 stop:2185 length:1185 start_codon:yes stop_codon:yes gene_type:complete